MRPITRRSLAAVSALGALAIVVGAQGGAAGKRWVCHGTASVDNPYVLIYVSDNAIVQGHASHGWKSNPDQIATADPPNEGDFTGACGVLWDPDGGGGEE